MPTITKEEFCREFAHREARITDKSKAIDLMRVEVEGLKKSLYSFAGRHINELTKLRSGSKLNYLGKRVVIEEVESVEVYKITKDEFRLYFYIRLTDKSIVGISPEPDGDWDFVKEEA